MTDDDLALIWTCPHCGRQYSTPPDPPGAYAHHVRLHAGRTLRIVADGPIDRPH